MALGPGCGGGLGGGAGGGEGADTASVSVGIGMPMIDFLLNHSTSSSSDDSTMVMFIFLSPNPSTAYFEVMLPLWSKWPSLNFQYATMSSKFVCHYVGSFLQCKLMSAGEIAAFKTLTSSRRPLYCKHWHLPLWPMCRPEFDSLLWSLVNSQASLFMCTYDVPADSPSR